MQKYKTGGTPPRVVNFSHPPVVEVVLGVQFESLTNLSIADIGLLHGEYRSRFPNYEAHPPLVPAIERYDKRRSKVGGVQFSFNTGVELPRSWFLNDDGSELIQIQPDRFVHNWRKTKDQSYPRYPSIRSTFESEMQRFSKFAAERDANGMVVKQCEVTYVNHIQVCNVWSDHSELGKVFTFCGSKFGDQFLPELEKGGASLHFVFDSDSGHPLGRLHATIDSAYSVSDDKPIFTMQLTARGAPLGDGVDGVLAFLDMGREWIVNGFVSLTTDAMHKVWGRQE